LTFVVAETNDFGGYTILKQADSLLKLSNMDILPGIFPAVFISRDDVARALDIDYEDGDALPEKIKNLTDEEMIDICYDVQNQYVEYGSYWDDIEAQCEDLHDE
jgi:hypothetical protein